VTVLQNSAEMALTYYSGLCVWRFLSNPASAMPPWPVSARVYPMPPA